jgi:hypothetical protein
MERRYVPPFVKAYVTVIVHVDFIEEAVESSGWHSQTRRLEGIPELLLSEPAVSVAVDRLEQEEELALSSLDEYPEF